MKTDIYTTLITGLFYAEIKLEGDKYVWEPEPEQEGGYTEEAIQILLDLLKTKNKELTTNG